MKILKPKLTALALLFSLILVGCSAEDGQDGLAGRDGEDGKDGIIGSNGADGNANVIDTGWLGIPGDTWGPRTVVTPEITLGLPLDGVTAAQLESSAVFAYIRFPASPADVLALPALLNDGDPAITDYEIVFTGINDTAVLFTLRTDDRSDIPVAATFGDFEIKFILIPASTNINAIDLSSFLD